MSILKVLIITGTIVLGVFSAQLFLGRAESSPPVADGALVLIEFTLTVPESRIVIHNNVSRFVPGHHEILPHLEQELTGMKKGEEKRVDVSAEEAFGQYDESKNKGDQRGSLASRHTTGINPQTEEGVPFMVVGLSGPLASIDFNHPLAGKHLIIDVKILNVELPGGERDLQFDSQIPSEPLGLTSRSSYR